MIIDTLGGQSPDLMPASRRGNAAFQIADCRLQIGGRARPRMVSLVETMPRLYVKRKTPTADSPSQGG